MANEYTSKVVLSNGEVLIDLTKDDILPEHVQKDITFHDKTGAPKTGTNTKTVDASKANATAAELLINRTAGVGDKIITGTMPDNSGSNVEINDTSGAPIPKGYTDGSTKAVIAPAELVKLVPGNIKEGVSILGVEGEYGADDISSQAKEVTPTFQDQQVQPDDGYTFLTGVLVKAITVTRADNEAGGVTVTIGA